MSKELEKLKKVHWSLMWLKGHFAEKEKDATLNAMKDYYAGCMTAIRSAIDIVEIECGDELSKKGGCNDGHS